MVIVRTRTQASRAANRGLSESPGLKTLLLILTVIALTAQDVIISVIL